MFINGENQNQHHNNYYTINGETFWLNWLKKVIIEYFIIKNVMHMQLLWAGEDRRDKSWQKVLNVTKLL